MAIRTGVMNHAPVGHSKDKTTKSQHALRRLRGHHHLPHLEKEQYVSIEQLKKPIAKAQVSAPNLRQRNAKIDSLTGLRFIAACLVFMAHTPPSMNFPIFVQHFIPSGSNGVTLFFILSGFVLCYNYYDSFTKNRFAATLKSFFVARFARVYPLHFLLFLLFFAATSVALQLQHVDLIFAQITLTQAWSSDPRVLYSYNFPAWSVSVEAFLYLCFPLLVIFVFKRATKIKHLCLIGLVAFSAVFLFATWFSIHGGVSVVDSTWLYTFPVTRLGDFILGCVAARIYVLHMSKPISRREQVLGVTLLLLSITAVLVLMASSNPFLLAYKTDSAYSLFFVVIIYALARYSSPLSTFLSTKVLVLLGEASYAFYLLHAMFLIHGLANPNLSIHLGQDLYIVIEFLLVVIVALGTYTYVETPLRKIIRQAFASRASAPAAVPPIPTAVG